MDIQLNLNVICRICLCDGDMRALDSQTDGNSTTYKDKILQCTNIKLKTNYNFPEQICIKCVDDLEIAYRFRMNCESSDAILNSYLEAHVKHVKQEKFDKIEHLDDDEFDDHTFDDDVDDDQLKNEEAIADTTSTRTPPVFSLPFPKPLFNIKAEEHDSPTVPVSKKKAKPRAKKIKEEQDGGDLAEKKVGIAKQLQICELCGSQCRSTFEMRIHMRRHRGEKPYQCEFCEKKFAAYGGLKVHLRTHTGERPYGCKFCERKFADFTTRIKHERTHTGERPYQCSHCGKAFSYSHVLANHIMTHTGEKKFHCQTCGKGFVKRHNLKIHQNVHLREQGKPVYATKKKKMPPPPTSDGQINVMNETLIIEDVNISQPDASGMVDEEVSVHVVEVNTCEMGSQYMYN